MVILSKRMSLDLSRSSAGIPGVVGLYTGPTNTREIISKKETIV
jgi:hypothetical protein